MMRNLPWLLPVTVAAAATTAIAPAGCGEVKDVASDAPPMRDSGDPPPDVPPTACITYAGAWDTSEIAFDAAIAPTSRLDFETRADGVTGVVAGAPVPRDEYLQCCGVRLEYIGPAGGQLIWAGNSQGGFSVRGTCPQLGCSETAGVRVTFVSPVTAAGVQYAGGTNGTMLDAQGNVISTMSMQGSGINFLGYRSPVLIDHADFVDFSAEDLPKLLYHRCQ